MIYEDYLSHMDRRYANIILLQQTQQQLNHIANDFTLNYQHPSPQHHTNDLKYLAHPFLQLYLKSNEKENIQHKLNHIQQHIEDIKSEVKEYGECIGQWKDKITQIGSVVCVGCKQEVQAIHKVANKINAVNVVNKYIENYFVNMGCQRYIDELLSFVRDFYSQQIYRQFRQMTNGLTKRYYSLKHQSSNKYELQNINEMIEKYENRLDAAIHQLQAANKNKMNIMIDYEIVTNQLQTVQLKHDQILQLIRCNVRAVLEDYVHEYQALEQGKVQQYEQQLFNIIEGKTKKSINQYINTGIKIHYIKQHINNDAQTIQGLEEEILKSTKRKSYYYDSYRKQSQFIGQQQQQQQYIQGNYTTFNNNFTISHTHNVTSRSRSKLQKLSIFRVFRKIYITNNNKKNRNNSKNGNMPKTNKKNTNKQNSVILEPQLQRTLSFDKKALILNKKNPHFHQQIQIKRIVSVELVNEHTVFVYFKKGYMYLYFVHADAHNWLECYQHNYQN